MGNFGASLTGHRSRHVQTFRHELPVAPCIRPICIILIQHQLDLCKFTFKNLWFFLQKKRFPVSLLRSFIIDRFSWENLNAETLQLSGSKKVHNHENSMEFEKSKQLSAHTVFTIPIPHFCLLWAGKLSTWSLLRLCKSDLWLCKSDLWESLRPWVLLPHPRFFLKLWTATGTTSDREIVLGWWGGNVMDLWGWKLLTEMMYREESVLGFSLKYCKVRGVGYSMSLIIMYNHTSRTKSKLWSKETTQHEPTKK